MKETTRFPIPSNITLWLPEAEKLAQFVEEVPPFICLKLPPIYITPFVNVFEYDELLVLAVMKSPEIGADFCIPPKNNESDPWYVDWWLYKERHLVETFFLKLKEFRRVATRYDKLADRFLAFVHLACIRILLA